MREKTPFILTAIAIAAVVAVLLTESGKNGDPDTPAAGADTNARRAVGRTSSEDSNRKALDDVVSAHFQSAKAGDIEGYLDCFSKAMRKRIREAVDDMGKEEFITYLKRMGSEPRGTAFSDWRVEDDGQKATVRVELVFEERDNEVQQFQFAKEDDRWRIDGMTEAEYLKMPVPYGTPAYPLDTGSEEPPPD